LRCPELGQQGGKRRLEFVNVTMPENKVQRVGTKTRNLDDLSNPGRIETA
jgi:hypothetical protein